MTLHLPSFAEKLRRYRNMFGESPEHLASVTGIALDVLHALEGASRAPTGDQVLILADHYRCDFKFFISNEQSTPIERTEKLFRAHERELSIDDRWAVQEFLFLCENEAFLCEELERRPPIPFRYVKRGTFFKAHGIDGAAALRRALKLDPSEVPDVFADLRRLGLHIFRRRLQNANISGLFINHPTAGPCVLVNYDEDLYRQRFTAAHEAAHAFFDVDDEYVVSLQTKDDLREVRANVFASAFLVPKSLVERLPGGSWTEERILGLAEKLRVNVKTLVIALERDGRLATDEVKRLQALKARHDKEDPELPASLSVKGRQRKTALLERGVSTYYAELCLEAQARSLISAARAAEMLLVDEAELREIATLFGGGGS